MTLNNRILDLVKYTILYGLYEIDGVRHDGECEVLLSSNNDISINPMYWDIEDSDDSKFITMIDLSKLTHKLAIRSNSGMSILGFTLCLKSISEDLNIPIINADDYVFVCTSDDGGTYHLVMTPDEYERYKQVDSDEILTGHKTTDDIRCNTYDLWNDETKSVLRVRMKQNPEKKCYTDDKIIRPINNYEVLAYENYDEIGEEKVITFIDKLLTPFL